MKQIYFLTTILFLTFINLNAQTVTLTGSCDIMVDGDYTLSTDVNGKPSFTNAEFIIQWTGTRWEHNPKGSTDVGMYNDADTANPPASSFSPWIGVFCDPPGSFTGDGTSDSTLSINEVKLTIVNLKVYPNPASDYITISGLKTTENYEIYNLIGQKIRKGITTNDESIDIQNLIKGIYLLKLENGNTLKFVKE
jgi:hypothetical protein